MLSEHFIERSHGRSNDAKDNTEEEDCGNTTDDEDDDDEVEATETRAWKKVFPFEIVLLRSMLRSKYFVKTWHVVYMLFFIWTVLYAVVLVASGRNSESGEPVSYVVLVYTQALMFFIMPYVSYYFTLQTLASEDVVRLVALATRCDKNLRLKFAVVTHMNLLILSIAFGLYVIEDHSLYSLYILIIFLYLGPLSVSVSLAVCVVELHRVKMCQLLSSINSFRSKLVSSDHRDDSSDHTCELSWNDKNRESKVDYIIYVTKLEDRYYDLYAICRRTSQSSGLYLLYFISFGFMFAFSTVYGIYLGLYPTKGIAAFVLVGVVVVVELSLVLALTNETGEIHAQLKSFLTLNSYVRSFGVS